MIPTLRFKQAIKAAFHAQSYGTDPYTPGRRSRTLLGEILGWGIDVPLLRYTLAGYGAALITNLPVDLELPLTPADGKRPTNKRTVVSESLLNAVSSALGVHPVAFANEKGGDLIHQIVPVPGSEKSMSNQGAHKFQMHTEATHFGLPPHFLALLCLRNTEGGATSFTSLNNAMWHAPEWVKDELRKNNFTQAMGESSGGGGRYCLPILSGPRHAPIYRVDFTDVEAITAISSEALNYMRERAHACAKEVVLEPGQMLVLNNHNSLHGRVGFTPDYSRGEQRWLQRQYMTRVPTYGRPVDDRYPHVWAGED